MTTKNRTLIFIPTYNESENVEKLFLDIKSLSLVADILFLDDNSPDGTGVIIDNMASNNNNVFVIHRICKLGIGSAHKEGIQWAYDNNYDVLITMDCDFLHSPKYITDFINYSINHDIVIGSKYLEKNSLKTWSLYRKTLTWLGHFLTATLLNLPFDSSGAFRLYNLNKIPKGVFRLIKSNSYSFFFESLFILNINKYTICEFAILTPFRIYGSSKMTAKDIFTSLKCLGSLYTQAIFNKRNFIYKD